jgi:hypothetical protein
VYAGGALRVQAPTVVLVQAAFMLKLSPITPAGEIPVLVMAPAVLTSGLGAAPGSIFGMTQGFTQRGCTGTMPDAREPEPEGLYTSAVAVALTPEFEEVPLVINEKTRAKKVGRFACCT